MTRAMTEVELAAFVGQNGFYMGRFLPDDSIACLIPLITTTAVIVGVTREGWERRFCFTHATDALWAYATIESEDDTPTGFVASHDFRGRLHG